MTTSPDGSGTPPPVELTPERLEVMRRHAEGLILPALHSTNLEVTKQLEAARASVREVADRAAATRWRALADGMAALPEEERTWIEEDPERLEDLKRRFLAASQAQADVALQREGARVRELLSGSSDFTPAHAVAALITVLALDAKDWPPTLDLSLSKPTPPAPGEPPPTQADHDAVEHIQSLAGQLAQKISEIPSAFPLEAPEVGAALWQPVRDAWRTSNAHALAARYEAKEHGLDANAEEEILRHATESALRRLKEAAPVEEFGPFRAPPPAGDPPAEVLAECQSRGLFLWDERAAVALESLGADGTPLRREGAKAAEALRTKARARWMEWASLTIPGSAPQDPPWEVWRSLLPFARRLARALWHGEVRDRLERDAKNPPALSLTVVGAVTRAFYEKDRQISFLPPADGRGEAVIVGADGEELARTAVLPASELEDLQRGALKLRGYVGHLVVRGFAVRGWEKTRAGDANPSILGWEGGLAACAQDLGAGSKKAADELRDILEAGQAFRRVWAGGEVGGLWSYVNLRQAPGRRAYLEVRLNRPLMPYAVHGLGPRERTLVPLPPMPPRVLAAGTWAPQAAFQLALVRAMVEKRTELVKEGGARFTQEELARLARAVGLSPELLPRVLDRWTRDGTDGLACLEKVGRDRFHLPANSDYQAARSFLEEGGLRSVHKAAAGRASVRARSAPRRRKKAKGGPGK